MFIKINEVYYNFNKVKSWRIKENNLYLWFGGEDKIWIPIKAHTAGIVEDRLLKYIK